MLYIGRYKDINHYRKLGFIPLSISNVRPKWYVEGSNEPLFAVPTDVMVDYDHRRITKEQYRQAYETYLDTVSADKFLQYIKAQRGYIIICQYDREDSIQKEIFTNYINKRFANEMRLQIL